MVSSSDEYALDYRDVDRGTHASAHVSTLEATANWPAIRRLRAWERDQLRLSAGERLLDVGCGRGEAAAALADDLGTNGELVGVDSSASMVEVARSLHGDARCPTRFVVGDARSLSQPGGSFDAVRSERTLQWLLRPDEVVGELVRVLRPGGRLSLIDTEWSSLRLDVGDPSIADAVRDGLQVEHNRASNVGGRLGELARSAGCSVLGVTSELHRWIEWDPDRSPAPDGFFSIDGLALDLVERGSLATHDVADFVDRVERAARQRRFSMSLRMHAMVATAGG